MVFAAASLPPAVAGERRATPRRRARVDLRRRAALDHDRLRGQYRAAALAGQRVASTCAGLNGGGAS